MEPYTLTVYGLSVLLNWQRRAVASVAAAFFAIEGLHGLIRFEYASGLWLSIAGLTLIPVMLCRFLDLGMAFRLRISCLVLVTIYLTAWIMVELNVPPKPLKYAHLAVLLYQFGVLNGGTGILVGIGQYWSSFRMRYTGRNQRTV